LEQYLKTYRAAGYTCLAISAFNAVEVQQLGAMMKDKVNLLGGHSGVGKSTLINAIDPVLEIKTGDISSAHNKGKHTTTYAEMHRLKLGGFIIDTPGIKELGLVDIEPEEVSHLFPEMVKHLNECKFNNCLHMNEPGCKIKEMVQRGELAESRYKSYLSILLNEDHG
jgi:ribosome biogenesis GTPase